MLVTSQGFDLITTKPEEKCGEICQRTLWAAAFEVKMTGLCH